MRELEALGVDATMLTGDCEATAQAVRVQVGIGDAVAGMKPSEKLERIRALRKKVLLSSSY